MNREQPSAAARMLAQAQRSADARKAWDEYQSERDQLARRTEKLKAQRLAAEEEAARKAAKVKKAKAPGKTGPA